MYGFHEAHLHPVAPGARFAPAVCAATMFVGVWLRIPAYFWALVPIAAIGVLTGRHPVDVAYNHTVARWFRKRRLPRCGPPRRFACTVGTLWLVTTALAFENGSLLAAGILAGLMTAAMFLTAALDFCLPCYAFDVLLRDRRMPTPMPMPVRVDSDAPTLVS
jgi:hypothetical protein